MGVHDLYTLAKRGACSADEEFEAMNNGFNVAWGPGQRYADPDSRACQSLRIDEFPSNYESPDHALFGLSDDDEFTCEFLAGNDEDYSGGIFFGAETKDINDQYLLMATRIGNLSEETEERVAHQRYLSLDYFYGDDSDFHEEFEHLPLIVGRTLRKVRPPAPVRLRVHSTKPVEPMLLFITKRGAEIRNGANIQIALMTNNAYSR